MLRQNQRNELAWLWFSSVVDSQEQHVKCLENVLTLNPHNTVARKRLARFQPLPQSAPVPSALQCPHCGTSNRVGARFCLRCGQRLGLTGPPSPPPSIPEATATARRQVDAPIQPSPGPTPAALRIASFFLLVTAGTWVISAIMAIGLGDLAAMIGVWNLLVCGVIVLVAIQLLQGNAKLCSTASNLFKTNFLLIQGQVVLFGETLDETILVFDVIGLAALGVQAAILWLGRKGIERWWQAAQRVQPAEEMA